MLSGHDILRFLLPDEPDLVSPSLSGPRSIYSATLGILDSRYGLGLFLPAFAAGIRPTVGVLYQGEKRPFCA